MEEAERKPQGSSRHIAQQLQRSTASNHSLPRRIFVSSGLREALSLAILQHWNKWPHTSLSTPSSQGPSSQTSTSSTATTRTTTASTAATNSGTNHYQQVTGPVFKETRKPVASPRGRQEIAPPPMHPAVEISEEADTSSEALVASMLAHQVQDDKQSNMSHYDYLQRSILLRKKSFSNWTTALKTERGT
jgi:hypothetical protein